jgi:hypothetical protein
MNSNQFIVLVLLILNITASSKLRADYGNNNYNNYDNVGYSSYNDNYNAYRPYVSSHKAYRPHVISHKAYRPHVISYNSKPYIASYKPVVVDCKPKYRHN